MNGKTLLITTQRVAHTLYVVDELTHTGVDVSSHQGFIDWEAVAADNIQFAMLRIIEAPLKVAFSADELFETNLKGAQSAGLDVGVCFFSQAINVEARRGCFVLQQLKEAGLQSSNLPVALTRALDYSGRADNLSPAETNAIARAFVPPFRSGIPRCLWQQS